MKILITGTSKGIGKSLANYYMEKGNIVMGCGRSDGEYNLPHKYYSIDIMNKEDVENMFWDIRNRFGSLDVVINNAGISSMNHSTLIPYSTAQNILSVNVLGTFLISTLAFRLMYDFGGNIVNFSTISHPLNLEGESMYSASKAAIESLTRTMSSELAKFKIRVNAIGPNPIKTDLIKNVSEEKMKSLINSQAIKEYSTWKDVANVIDFFISPDSKMITGQVIYLGGIS